MGRNWTRRSIEELIDDYLKKHAKVIPGPSGGLGAIHYTDAMASFFIVDAFNSKNTDNQGANYQQSIKPLKVPIDATGVDTLDTNFGLSYSSSTYTIGRFRKSNINSEYNRIQKPFEIYTGGHKTNTYYTYALWFYYDLTDNIVYRLKRNAQGGATENQPFPTSILTNGYIFQTRGDYITPPSNVEVSYVDYPVINVGQLYNMMNVQDIADLNDGYLIGTTIHLEDDFIKKYVQWFISNGTLPTSVQDLLVS